MNEGNAITQVAPLQAALAEATEAGDLNALRDVASMAAALQKGAKARGLGIEAENQAAEIVIRAERSMGLVLIEMEDAGQLASQGQGKRSGFTVATEIISGPSARQLILQWKTLARLTADEFESILQSALTKSGRLAKWNAYEAARPTPPPYPHDAVRDQRRAAGETENPESANFALLRTGIHRLLGWEVGEDLVGHATRNELLVLPDDQLAELKSLVEALAGAFSEARKARRPLQAVA